MPGQSYVCNVLYLDSFHLGCVVLVAGASDASFLHFACLPSDVCAVRLLDARGLFAL